jgi:hypothetical protein
MTALVKAALAAAALAFCVFYDPSAGPPIPVCGFHWLTGRPCPLCGLTRALCALGKGHWEAALRLHALSPLVLALLAWACLSALARLEAPALLRRHGWTALLFVFAAYGALRLTL